MQSFDLFTAGDAAAASESDAPPAMKVCFKCHKEQPIDEFYRHNKMRDKRLNKCRTCTKRENVEWRNRPEKRAAWNRRRHFKLLEKQFGITLEEFDAMYADPMCAGCGKSTSVKGRRLALDHCHKTGRVRGLLCHDCNRTIATAHDSPDILRALALYLERTNDDQP